MSERPAADSATSLPRALLVLAGACTFSVVLALVAAVLGRGPLPLWALVAPPVVALAWLVLRARRAGRRSRA